VPVPPVLFGLGLGEWFAITAMAGRFVLNMSSLLARLLSISKRWFIEEIVVSSVDARELIGW